MRDIRTAINRLIEGFDGFTDELRTIVDDLPLDGGKVAEVGAGEEPYDYPDGVREAPDRDDIDDDKIITLRSGDLRKVLDAYRKLVRFAREGRIPTQDQRMKGHQSVRKVKHLVRKPIR